MSLSFSETICPVIVVPTLAPKMTPMACSSERRPALTKPTVMTLVADELCTRAVTPAPARIANRRFRVM